MTTLTRRTMLTITAVVVLAVVIAGVVSYGLVRSAAQNEARRALGRQADVVAGLLTAGRPANLDQAMRAMRAENTPVARVLPGGGLRGDPLARRAIEPRLPAVLDGRSLSYRTEVGGRTVFVEARPLPNRGGIVLARPASTALQPALNLLRRMLLALAIGLVASVFAAWALARWLAGPLRRTAEAAGRLAAGERSVRLEPEGPREAVQVADSVNTLAAALEISEGRQRDFLLSVSHELRTPLTAIRGFGESLADGVTTGPAVADAGRTIVAESGRLQRLIGDLLDLARLGADDFRVDRTRVDLVAVLSEAARVWQARCTAAGVPFRAELPAAAMPADTDPGRLRQIVDGLAENALRVTPAGRPIVLALRADRDQAVIEVRDGGPGLTDDDLAVAFDRAALYERYRGVRKVGTGLGLALVHGLALRLGGTAEAGRAPEGGACFRIRLPLAAVAPAYG